MQLEQSFLPHKFMEPEISPKQPRGIEPDQPDPHQRERGSRRFARFAWRSCTLTLGLMTAGGVGTHFGLELFLYDPTREAVTWGLIKASAIPLGVTFGKVAAIPFFYNVNPFKREMQELGLI